ncbi:MAG: metal-dependent transcriptional regulator [Ignavibacteriales bacterium]|nr:metal-dependent transcriptional regulator [Ignavibacteriales bacterium]
METITAEDYIKRIYSIERHSNFASTSSIAKALEVSDASANDMMKRLSEQGYVKYIPRKGVQLTKKGKIIALKIVRRHRLWEMFLVKFLGYSWDEIHNEAERLEHVTSESLEARIDKALNFPTVDPHGDPIPTANGELIETEYQLLNDCEKGSAGIISRVSDKSPEVLQYLKNIGLGLQTKLKIVDKISFDGSIIVKANKQIIPLSPKLAQCIFIQPVTA